MFENVPGHRFKTDSYSDTDSTKHDFDLSSQHLMIINKDNLYLQLNAF